LDLSWGQRHKIYHALFPDKPIEITEYGDSTPNLSEESMANAYVAFLKQARKHHYVRSAHAFIASSPDPAWAQFSWIRGDGSLKIVAHKVAELPRPPKVAPEDWTRKLPRRGEYAQRDFASLRYIVVHHSATSPDVPLEAIALYHVEKRGWPGIGYHFVITAEGKIYQTNEADRASYHCAGLNEASIGVCLLGNYVQSWPPEPQLESLKALLRYLLIVYEIAPSNIIGHKEVRPTTCPGTWWDTFKMTLKLY
jgi:hypothetical protein